MAPLSVPGVVGGALGDCSDDDNFFRSTVFALARSLSKIPRVDWGLVRDPLFSQCPQPGENGWVLSERSQVRGRGRTCCRCCCCCCWWGGFFDVTLPLPTLSPACFPKDAALALGIFFLEGGCQCSEQVLPYLLRLESALFEAAVQERRGACESKASYIFMYPTPNLHRRLFFFIPPPLSIPKEIPAAENFAFALNTLLSDVAVTLPSSREAVFAAQVDLFLSLASAVRELKEQREPLPQNTKGACSAEMWLYWHPTNIGITRGAHTLGGDTSGG